MYINELIIDSPNKYSLTSVDLFRFINARRRIVQPMIDQSNRAGPQNGTPGNFSPDTMGYPGVPQATHGNIIVYIECIHYSVGPMGVTLCI